MYRRVILRQHNFYPRPPRGGRRLRCCNHLMVFVFLSTPSARRATTYCFRSLSPDSISIHALREEGDGDGVAPEKPRDLFLSTPSARRATSQPTNGSTSRPISIHALREEGDDDYLVSILDILNFYPRPPRGGRPISSLSHADYCGFLSTPSARRATAVWPQISG